MTVQVRDVLPRDGFQDLETFVPTAVKIEVICRLHEAGLRWVEVTSLVHPRQVPQFTDADEVLAAALALEGLRVSVFAPNLRGVERAVAGRADEVSLAVATTDELATSNFKRGREEVVQSVLAAVGLATQERVAASVTIGGAFGCPFTGAVESAAVTELVRRLADAGVATVLLADTIGSGTPEGVGRLVIDAVAARPELTVGVHLHGGLGSLAGVDAAVDAGATIVDASTTGAGGCPFVPSAPGNVPTDAVVRTLGDRAEGGLDPDELMRCAVDVRALLEQAASHV